jgi:hypothetical protein
MTSYIIRPSVAPEHLIQRAKEDEHDQQVLAETFAAHAHVLTDRVYGALHYPDETPWYDRSPAWVLDKMREVSAVRARESVTEQQIKACLRRLVHNGRLDPVSRGDVFYKARLM